MADKSWFCLSLNMYVGLECLPPTCEAGILTLILALSINGVALRYVAHPSSNPEVQHPGCFSLLNSRIQKCR